MVKSSEADYDLIDPEIAGWRGDPWDHAEEVGRVERLRGQNRLVKWGAYSVMCVTLVAILVAGATGWWYVNKINPEGEPGDPRQFIVDDRDTLQSVSERLEERGWISDAGVFRWYVRNHGGLELIPGYYEIAPGDHMGNVMGRLQTPPSETYTRVTFPEGFTVEQVAERLATDGPRMTVRDFEQAAANPDIISALRPPGATSLEGLLFPDTYQVSNSESEAQVIERMIVLMERVGVQEEIIAKSAGLGRTPYETLIVASIIEEEALLAEDRPKIARVIYNRLAMGMALEIDATLLYQQDRSRPIPELALIDTPYNTYMHTGLPPTPITNPGRASIQAALNPAPDPAPGDPICRDLPDPSECPYLFYVLIDVDGRHAFAATGEQHAANVRRAIDAGVL